MPDEKKKSDKPEVQKIKEPEKLKESAAESREDDFDFGGIPSEVSFSRNLGCGG